MDGSSFESDLLVEGSDCWARTFDAVPDLIVILDDQHRVVRANRAMAAKLGKEPDELVGLACYEVVHGADGPPAFCPHSTLLCDGLEHSAEMHDDRLGGDFLVSVSPLRDSSGTVRGSVHVARDISHQKQAEMQAREAVRRREQFLAMLSHELRNPLGAILNAAYIVKKAPPAQSAFHDALAVIERQARQMSHLLDDLLDVSRVMQGKIDLRRRVVNMADVLADAVHVVQPLFDERGHQLQVQLQSTRLPVDGDPTRLQQVQVNLLANAAKYTPPGGKIRLAARCEGEHVVISTEDNGQGISGDALDRIFDLFVQVDDSLHRQDGGMGVGLTLVRMLVEMHGGSVAAESAGPGRGSRFVVRLPLVVETAGQPDEDAAGHDSPNAAKVLIVEDNPDTRAMLEALLTLDGHRVTAAEDGAAGLATLESENFDVALIDIGLPELDGYEVVRRFRSHPRPRRPHLVALTGYGQPADRDAVFAAGFDEHLVKPCDPADLERILRMPR